MEPPRATPQPCFKTELFMRTRVGAYRRCCGVLEKARPEQQVLLQYPKSAGKPFQPSNGTEGMIWMEAFCDRCARECVAGNYCRIQGLALGFGVGDKEYPEEWIYDPYGWGICTAWKSRGGPRRRKPCPRTPDMFGPHPVRIGVVDGIVSQAVSKAEKQKDRVATRPREKASL